LIIEAKILDLIHGTVFALSRRCCSLAGLPCEEGRNLLSLQGIAGFDVKHLFHKMILLFFGSAKSTARQEKQ